MAASDWWKIGRVLKVALAAQQALDLEQIAIPQHGLERGHLRVGPHHGETVVAGFLGKLADIDLEVLAAGLEVTPVGRVADHERHRADETWNIQICWSCIQETFNVASLLDHGTQPTQMRNSRDQQHNDGHHHQE